MSNKLYIVVRCNPKMSVERIATMACEVDTLAEAKAILKTWRAASEQNTGSISLFSDPMNFTEAHWRQYAADGFNVSAEKRRELGIW